MIDKRRIGGAFFALGAIFVVLITTGATTQAQTGDHRYDDRSNCYGTYGRQGMYRIAQENGYRDGVEHGREHRVERHSYDPRGTRHYKDGVEGYCRDWNDKDAYKRVYREGFLRGYDVGYRGGYGRDPYDRDEPYYRDQRGHDDDYRYGRNDDYRYGRNDGRNDTYRIAQENGYREGLRHGEEDRNRRRNYDYSHSDHYRDADSGYRSEYRDRELYRQGYRDGYRRGYDEGYGRRNGGWGGVPRTRWPLPWPF